MKLAPNSKQWARRVCTEVTDPLHVNQTAVATAQRVDNLNPNEIFEGNLESASGDVDATDEAIWQIKRTTIQGAETVVEYANDGAFDQIWDDRASLFDPIPFVNTYSVLLDGVNDYVSTPDNDAFDFAATDAFTLSFWIKSNDLNSTYFEKMDGNVGWMIRSTSNRLTIEFRNALGNRIRIRDNANPTAALEDGEWHHVVVTKASGSSAAASVTMYIDAVALTPDVQNDTLTLSPENAGQVGMGSRSGGGDYTTGFMDEFSIHDAEADADAVTAMYNGGVPIDLSTDSGDYDISASLQGWWRFTPDDVTNFPTIEDQAGNQDGTANNFPSGNLVTEVPT